MPKKRGQMLGEPLVWISALVVAALILFFGAKSVINIIDASSQAKIADFVQDFRNNVEEIFYSDTGSSKLVQVDMPGKISKVCFYTGYGSLSTEKIDRTDIDAIRLVKDKNMFFFPLNAYEGSLIYDVDNIRTSSLICFKNKNKIKLTSKADYVEVARPSDAAS